METKPLGRKTLGRKTLGRTASRRKASRTKRAWRRQPKRMPNLETKSDAWKAGNSDLEKERSTDMKLPGFTAEAAVYDSGGLIYETVGAMDAPAKGAVVAPQQIG